MIKKDKLGEVHDLLRIIPVEQLRFFSRIRKNADDWKAFLQFCGDQKQYKLTQIYKLKRPVGQDELVRNAIEHEYLAARITSLVLLLQLMENADEELERRERKAK
jgi:hypothetical protein